MTAGEKHGGGPNRQPVRLALPRGVPRRRERAGIFRQPTVALEFQNQSKRYVVRGVEDGRRLRLSSQVLFRGTQGYLSLELWGKDQEAAGRIMPKFSNRSGERKEIPLRFLEAVKAAVNGAIKIDCREAVLARAGDPQ